MAGNECKRTLAQSSWLVRACVSACMRSSPCTAAVRVQSTWDWAIMATIAISGTPAYDIADAENALVDALAARSGGARMLVADILALIDTDRAQRALFDGALTATTDEQIDLLDRVAESVKRWGDRSEPRHIANVIDLIVNAGPDTAEAAARVHGALNLPVTDAIDLILETD